MKRSLSASASTDEKHEARPNGLTCFICMEAPTEPVASACGHIFCWSCIHPWLGPNTKPCPVCRHALKRNRDIIPLYGPRSCSGTGTSSSASSGNGDTRPLNPLLPASEERVEEMQMKQVRLQARKEELNKQYEETLQRARWGFAIDMRHVERKKEWGQELRTLKERLDRANAANHALLNPTLPST